MSLKPYFFKQKLVQTYSGYGTVAESLESCPLGKVEKIGVACALKGCCVDHAPYMSIVEKPFCWIKCEPTTQLMEDNPTLGRRDNCVIEIDEKKEKK